MANLSSMLMSAPFAISDAKAAVKEGDTPLVALTKGVGTQIAFDVMGPWAFAVQGVQLAGTGLIAGGKNQMETQEKIFDRRGQFGSGHFDMSQAGYTMRQRSLNAIHSNGLNLQSTLGNEARTYYRSAT